MTTRELSSQDAARASSAEAAPRYQRVPRYLSRDTGRHVLVLPPAEHREVQVLGGGGAVIWRLLEQPLDKQQIMAAFGDSVPSSSEIDDCLALLLRSGVIRSHVNGVESC